VIYRQGISRRSRKKGTILTNYFFSRHIDTLTNIGWWLRVNMCQAERGRPTEGKTLQAAVIRSPRARNSQPTIRASMLSNSQKTARRFSCSSGIPFKRGESRSENMKLVQTRGRPKLLTQAKPLRQFRDESHEIPRISDSFLVIGKYQVKPHHEKLLELVSLQCDGKNDLPKCARHQNPVLP